MTVSIILKTIFVVILAAAWGYFGLCAWAAFFAPEAWLRSLNAVLTLVSGICALMVSLIVALWWRKV